LSKKEIKKKEYVKNSKIRSREIAKMRENKNSFTETYVVDSYDYNYSGYEYCRGCKVWGCKHGYGCGGDCGWYGCKIRKCTSYNFGKSGSDLLCVDHYLEQQTSFKVLKKLTTIPDIANIIEKYAISNGNYDEYVDSNYDEYVDNYYYYDIWVKCVVSYGLN
jgi:hypothetical protein